MNDKKLRIQFADENFELRGALISGKDSGIFGQPISLYCGPLDLDEIHSALYYANRAVVRMLTEEFGVEFDQVDSFLLSAVAECMTKELNVRANGQEDLDVRKSVKYRGNNQN
jgi:hypothetical protein